MVDKLLAEIAEKKNRLAALGPLPKALSSNLSEWYKIELTYTSNAIEGNTLNARETAMVVEDGITVEGKTVREHLEAINHAKAYELVRTLSQKPRRKITERDILEVHTVILENIDSQNAGRYRHVPVRIAGSRVTLPNPLKVPDLMDDFVNWLYEAKGPEVKIAADAHFKLVSIHPFIDGNGRTARLLMNLVLMQAGYPPAIIRREERGLYIDSLEKGQLKGDLNGYYALIYQSIIRSLDLYLAAMNKEKSKVKSKDRGTLLKIGQLAKESGETVAAIRFWTKEGLLKVAGSTKKGYQLYDRKALVIIRKIRFLQKEKRLTIGEIGQRLKMS